MTVNPTAPELDALANVQPGAGETVKEEFAKYVSVSLHEAHFTLL